MVEWILTIAYLYSYNPGVGMTAEAGQRFSSYQECVKEGAAIAASHASQMEGAGGAIVFCSTQGFMLEEANNRSNLHKF